MFTASAAAIGNCQVERLRLDLNGAVQGVGFRPFIYRLAGAEGLNGFVRNTGSGVTIEIEGGAHAVARFLELLDVEMPPHAAIHARHIFRLAPRGGEGFSVASSDVEDVPSALVMPDLATCPECLHEILDPADRRFAYPFTTCIHCGPRYSIVRALPYDRERTTMRLFSLCALCRGEYADPASRRFHAESIACPECGPHLSLWDKAGRELASHDTALAATAEALRQGYVLAVKGLGGFQLLVDAQNEEAVRRLRLRKQRPRKPFAVMVPSLAAAEAVAQLSDSERTLLSSPQAPIVLLCAHEGAACLAPSIAPGNPLLGIMLPYTPLHHLLLREFTTPVVATSGNLGNEPIITDEHEALERLGGVADRFLVHDRQILHPVDNSVVRVIAGREVVLRRARGYAPMPIAWPAMQVPVLALGGQQKNAVATGFDGRIFLGPHIGDLSAPQAREACDRMAEELTSLHALKPSCIVCDAHPDYYTSRAAVRSGLPVARVPHHLAHVLSGMIDNELEGPVLGVAWDGTGYGGDGTVWGGEFLRVDKQEFHRCAHLLPFPLPGGEAAVREPRRAALGVLYTIFGEHTFEMTNLAPLAAFVPEERRILATMLKSGINTPRTSSAGRLFDAVASLLGFVQTATFEGEAAMAVEFAAGRADVAAPLSSPTLVERRNDLVVDWRPLFAAIIAEFAGGRSAELLAATLHEGLAMAIVAVAEHAGIDRVLLTGGCFQNALLTECAVNRLRAAGFAPFWHHRIPPNDGGLAAGQLAFAAKPLRETS